MLSLVERGRAPPSIGSLIVIANSLGITMSDLMASDEARQDKLVVHFSDVPIVETAKHVVRRLLRDDRERGISIALNEYAPQTGSAEQPISHSGFEYGFILEGELSFEAAVSHSRSRLNQSVFTCLVPWFQISCIRRETASQFQSAEGMESRPAMSGDKAVPNPWTPSEPILTLPSSSFSRTAPF